MLMYAPFFAWEFSTFRFKFKDLIILFALNSILKDTTLVMNADRIWLLIMKGLLTVESFPVSLLLLWGLEVNE